MPRAYIFRKFAGESEADVPKYKYTAFDAAGLKRAGTITAEDETAVYEKLKSMSLLMLDTEIVRDKEEVRYRPMPLSYISEFCEQISVMLNSGITLVRALNILCNDENTSVKQKKSCSALVAEIYKGEPLSAAMEAQGEAYPALLINMIRSAETSGSLDKTMKKMSEYYESQNRLKKKVSGATMYPKFLFGLLILAVIGIMAFIVPQFESVFAMLDELPWITAFVLGISSFVKNEWYLLIAGIIFLVIIFRLLGKVPAVRKLVDKTKLYLPIVGKMLKTIYTARFATSLNSLYSSGITITTALQLSRHNIGNMYIDNQFDGVISTVKQGIPLSKALESVDGFSGKLYQIVMVGEESGKLGEMLDSIAKRFEYETEVTVDKMVKLIEPLMIIIMGVIIGFIMVSVMLPIIQTYSAIEQSAQY